MSDDMDDNLRDLVEFLRARIDEDERAAQEASPGPWRSHTESMYRGPVTWVSNGDDPSDSEGWVIAYDGGPPVGMVGTADAVHIARHDPARVLAEVEWKRSIIARCVRAMDRWGSDSEYSVGEHVMNALAAMYADHPDYRPEWKPHRWHLPAEHGEGVVR